MATSLERSLFSQPLSQDNGAGVKAAREAVADGNDSAPNPMPHAAADEEAEEEEEALPPAARRQQQQQQQALPWWKRILIDADYRTRLTSLATVCYRQELFLLEKHPFLLSTQSPAVTRQPPAQWSPPAATTTAKSFPPPNSKAQFVAIPSAPTGTVKMWDTIAGNWLDTCISTIYDRQRPWLASTMPSMNSVEAKATSIRRTDKSGMSRSQRRRQEKNEKHGNAGKADEKEKVKKEEAAFSLKHPPSIIKHSGLASKQRAQPGQALDTAEENPVYCSSEAMRCLRPDSPNTRRKKNPDDFDRRFGGGIDGVRRLCKALDTPAYRAFYHEGYITELVEEQKDLYRRQLREKRQKLGRPLSAMVARAPPPGPLPQLLQPASQTAAAAASASTARYGEERREKHHWASPPRTKEEIEIDNVLGLSYFWRGVLPPSGYIRLAPDPRRAMWTDAFEAEETQRRRGCPRIRKKLTTQELLQDPKTFNKAIADAFNTPLCIHIFREKAALPPSKPAAAAPNAHLYGATLGTTVATFASSRGSAKGVDVPQEEAASANTTKAASPTDPFEYLGTFRQSLLLVHVKVYFRALHEEQRMRAVGPTAHLGGCGSPPARSHKGAAGGGNSSGRGAVTGDSVDDAGEGGDQPSISMFNQTLKVCPFEPGESAKVLTWEDMSATAAEKKERDQERARDAERKEEKNLHEPICPELLHGVPEVPFPVLRVGTAGTRHDPVPATTPYVISKAAALVEANGARVKRIENRVGAADQRNRWKDSNASQLALPRRTLAEKGTLDTRMTWSIVANNPAANSLLKGNANNDTNVSFIAAAVNCGDNSSKAHLSPGMWMGLSATPNSQPLATAFAAARVWRQLHFHSGAARTVVKDIFLVLPRDAEGCLGKEAYLSFVLGLLNLFFPTHLSSPSSAFASSEVAGKDSLEGADDAKEAGGDSTCHQSIHAQIAEEEWAYRGSTENLTFATFFEKFFSFPFIFLRDLATVTENDYVEFWTIVKVALFKDTTNMISTLTSRVLDHMQAQHEQQRGGVVAPASQPTTPTAAPSAPLGSAVDATCGAGSDVEKGEDAGGASWTEEERLLALLHQHNNKADLDGPAQGQRAFSLPDRQGSVLFNQRLSRDMGFGAAKSLLSEFTTAQLYTLYLTDFSQKAALTTQGQTKLFVLKEGGGAGDEPLPAVAATTPPSTSSSKGSRRQGTAEVESQLHDLSGTLTSQEMSETLSAALPAQKVTLMLGPDTVVDGLDDRHGFIPRSQHALANLLKRSIHYQRRHEKYKMECLNNIALHNGVASTWELYHEDVYRLEPESKRVVADMKTGGSVPVTATSCEQTHHAALMHSPPLPVSPSSSTASSFSLPKPEGPQRSPDATVDIAYGSKRHTYVPTSATTCLPAIRPIPAATASRSPGKSPSQSDTRPTNDGTSIDVNNGRSAESIRDAATAEREADEEMERLISFIADVPDEVFGESQVSVRERFQTYEAFQRARRNQF